MKRIILVVAVLLMLLSALALACPADVSCPIHDMQSYFTGRTVTIDGALMGYYRCPRGHEFLVRCN